MSRQLKRTIVQILGLGLTAIGFFINFKWTMGIIMILIVIGGTIYCGWLCPYGTLQEFANQLARFFKIKQKKMPKRVHKYLKYMRYIVLVLNGLITSSILFSIMSFEPRNNLISLLMGYTPAIIALVVLIGFILLSMVYERFYCNYLCYEGAKYGLMSLARPITIHRDKDKCINCGKCDSVCSMNIEVSKFEVLRSPQCINCFKCVDDCPVEDTLVYGFKPKKLWSKQYILIISALLILIPTFVLLNSLNSSEAEEVSVDTLSIQISNNQSESTLSDSIDDVINNTTDETATINESVTTNETVTANEPAATSETTTIIETTSTSLYTDGVYTGEGMGFRGTIYVSVTVESDVIKEIIVTDHSDDAKWYNRAVSIIDDIMGSQSTDVDLVGGATYSSVGIREAVEAALEKAK